MNNTPTTFRTAAEVQTIGIRALMEALGPADTARFIQHYSPGLGDYTAERHTWLDELSDEDIFRLVAEQETALRSK